MSPTGQSRRSRACHFRCSPMNRHSLEPSTCLKAAKNGSVRARAARPFYPQVQTSSACPGMSVWCQLLTHAPQQQGVLLITSSSRASTVHSGNPAFRRPSVTSCAFDCPPQALHPDIVKAGLTSSRRAAASRASASRPRWAKADARQK
jgi:hypothetical protein